MYNDVHKHCTVTKNCADETQDIRDGDTFYSQTTKFLLSLLPSKRWAIDSIERQNGYLFSFRFFHSNENQYGGDIYPAAEKERKRGGKEGKCEEETKILFYSIIMSPTPTVN